MLAVTVTTMRGGSANPSRMRSAGNNRVGFSPPPCGEGSGVGVVRGGTPLPQPPDPPPRPSPTRNRVYAGFGHSLKRSKSATADFDWGEGGRTAAPYAIALCPKSAIATTATPNTTGP